MVAILCPFCDQKIELDRDLSGEYLCPMCDETLLYENMDLIVDRNPKRNHLARSTPELIVRRLASRSKGPTSEIFTSLLQIYIKKLKNIGANNSYVTDKLPHNFVLIGFIKILFPNAKIIYCKRDKTDNCFSLYTHKFVDKSHGYCYNQKVLGKYYNLHLRLMEYWLNIFKNEIYVLNHEKLINDQEKYTREILDYCELKWEPACLEFYKTKREVQTASNEQVREPINKKSVSAWKKYDKVLEPLIKSLMG